MPGEMQNDSSPSNRLQSADGQTKKVVITQELVMAIADRVYAMLIQEMKIERERHRFHGGFRRRYGAQ